MKMEETDSYFLLLLFYGYLIMLFYTMWNFFLKANMAYAENMHVLVVKEYIKLIKPKQQLMTSKLVEITRINSLTEYFRQKSRFNF
jgi:hypothetical protein